MPKYNIDALGTQEFERFCQGLVQKIIGPGAKVYGMGKDGAREATFQGKAPYPSKEEQWQGSWIFQAKFHDVQQIGPNQARRRLFAELDDELSKILEKYKHSCDNYILMTNVTLTPVFQTGIKDRIDDEIIPKYSDAIKHIHVWGADEICRFLDNYPNIRQTYANFLVSGDIIARLLKVIEREETDLDERVQLYCQGCFDHEQYAALDDAGDVEDERVALQRIFVDLDVKPQKISQNPQMLERLSPWLKQAAEDEDRTSALSYLLDDSIPGLVLIGGPGEGKSTLGQYLGQIHRARLIGRLHELGQKSEAFDKCLPRIPFRILLKEYAQWISSRKNSSSLFHYLALQVSQESGTDTNTEHMHKIIKSNPILLILDGLDEVPEKKLRRGVLDNITSFVHQGRDALKGDIRVVATTRPYGYSEEFDPITYLHLTLQKLSSEKASSYTRSWIDAREPNPIEAERIKNTFDICLKDKVVCVLTQTPLQVTILLVIIRARGTPPKQREELFERYMDIIYQREQKKRPELLRTEQGIIYGIHKYLAYILHKRAEKDRTAALMDTSEFRDNVKEYLIHSNPLLNEKEIEKISNQIITEASQRLVLIESPQEGKIGFGLTTTREFFAAAHLVDTAKDTKERDLRFRAIATSPYWRNLALFFSGRVGRTRPGEAPSMIDVCRQIDTERVDRLLKRGAEMVIEMVDDRVLREPHNEVGAIQYGLTLLDKGVIKDSEELTSKLKCLPKEYKERVIRPWIKQRLNNITSENLQIYTNVYQELFGFGEPLYDAIKRASKFESGDVKLWALSQAIQNKIVEPWVTQLLEELVDKIPFERTVRTLEDCWINFGFYMNFSLSPKARTAIAIAVLEGSGGHRHLPETSKLMDVGSLIRTEAKINENSLYMWAILLLTQISITKPLLFKRDLSVEFQLPSIANPNVRIVLKQNANLIQRFCKTFAEENDPFTRFIVSLLDFLLQPYDVEKYINVYLQIQELRNVNTWAAHRVSLIIGKIHVDEEMLYDYYHKNLYKLYEHYESEGQYRKDSEELNEMINKKSRKVKSHPHKLTIWIQFNCDPKIEELLDSQIVSDVKVWLKQRGLSLNALALCLWSKMITPELELRDFALRILEKQLDEKRKHLRIPFELGWYIRHKSKAKTETAFVNRLKRAFEEILANYSSVIVKKPRQFETLYWSALKVGVIEEKHMTQLHNMVKSLPYFSSPWFMETPKNIWSTLVNMLQSQTLEVASLAAVSLLAVSKSRFSENREIIKETWAGDKYWELAKDKKDNWRPRYIRGMVQCRLKWKENWEVWLDAIKEANTEELQWAWREVIEKAGYRNASDLDSLLNLLLSILESGGTFPKLIRFAALRRLEELVPSLEPIGFDEKPLNLPLSRRVNISFS